MIAIKALELVREELLSRKLVTWNRREVDVYVNTMEFIDGMINDLEDAEREEGVSA
jgi:hypothetical protein